MFKKITQWYRNHFTLFIQCNRTASTIKLSRPLWEHIKRDQRIIDALADDPQQDNSKSETIIDARDISGFAVLFSKVRKDNKINYIFFVNPVWKMHGISNPRMIQTVPISISELGNVGFQTIQPSVEEIASVYGIPADHTTFTIHVHRSMFHGEPYYELIRP